MLKLKLIGVLILALVLIAGAAVETIPLVWPLAQPWRRRLQWFVALCIGVFGGVLIRVTMFP